MPSAITSVAQIAADPALPQVFRLINELHAIERERAGVPADAPEPAIMHAIEPGQLVSLRQELKGLAEMITIFAEQHRTNPFVEIR